MAADRDYTIQFGGLKNGSYRYEMELGDSFWAEFPTSGILAGKARVEVEMERTSGGLGLSVVIEGDVVVECDRCLDPVELPVDYEGELVVRFSDELSDDDGETLWLATGETELDLKQYIYESIVLSLPLQRVHDEGECNTEVTKLIVES